MLGEYKIGDVELKQVTSEYREDLGCCYGCYFEKECIDCYEFPQFKDKCSSRIIWVEV